jgi:hypothetical protein
VSHDAIAESRFAGCDVREEFEGAPLEGVEGACALARDFVVEEAEDGAAGDC